ncbi:phosphotransferase [Embleya sp. NBC_00888]|uniref:phosphotransferase n=1 Tax=Embleya sp. NBC_00888 TaxID=2975960 RepID=UPI00386EF038|nr:phosphotransferase [Embleya sp. NBC_00888]
MPRIDWDDLPAAVHYAVEVRTGPVLKAMTATEGVNSGIATLLHVPAGKVFLKGIPSGHGQVRTQEREALINPYVVAVSPRLLWRFEAGGWNLLGFEAVPGRHADFAPGSPDLPRVAAVLRRLGEIPLPDVPLKRLDERFVSYVNEDDRALLQGNALLHTDCAPHNVLVSDQRALLIDWAWPTSGPAWADPAYLITRLIDAGHAAHDADQWARQELPAWATAPRPAVAVFAQACARLWTEIAANDPQDWKTRLERAAVEWARHTSGTID